MPAVTVHGIGTVDASLKRGDLRWHELGALVSAVFEQVSEFHVCWACLAWVAVSIGTMSALSAFGMRHRHGPQNWGQSPIRCCLAGFSDSSVPNWDPTPNLLQRGHHQGSSPRPYCATSFHLNSNLRAPVMPHFRLDRVAIKLFQNLGVSAPTRRAWVAELTPPAWCRFARQ